MVQRMQAGSPMEKERILQQSLPISTRIFSVNFLPPALSLPGSWDVSVQQHSFQLAALDQRALEALISVPNHFQSQETFLCDLAYKHQVISFTG